MTDETGRIRELETLRVIAHPLRVRLYELLATEGPSTATQLSRQLSIPSNTLSYHLRQLSSHDLVHEADDLSRDGRERWWRASPGGLHWSAEDFPDSPGSRAVLRAAEHVIATRRVARLREWLDSGSAEWGPAWSAAARSSDSMLTLSQDELEQFGAEMETVVARWVDRSRAAKANPADDTAPVRARIFTFFHAFPIGSEGGGVDEPGT